MKWLVAMVIAPSSSREPRAIRVSSSLKNSCWKTTCSPAGSRRTLYSAAAVPAFSAVRGYHAIHLQRPRLAIHRAQGRRANSDGFSRQSRSDVSLDGDARFGWRRQKPTRVGALPGCSPRMACWFSSGCGGRPHLGQMAAPLMPTLIIIDAAARDTERTGKVLRALAGRGPASGARLAAPVRVLLVERNAEGEWLKKISTGDETRKKQLDLARAPHLPLSTIDDPWPIFEFVLNQKGKALPDKSETLAALAEIDSERRPQFAYFMADAIARGVDIRDFDAARLLEEVIEHGRKSYWKPARATATDERLLAVATMAGGLPVSAVKGLTDELLPSWNIDHHPKVFLAMTGQKSGQNMRPAARHCRRAFRADMPRVGRVPQSG